MIVDVLSFSRSHVDVVITYCLASLCMCRPGVGALAMVHWSVLSLDRMRHTTALGRVHATVRRNRCETFTMRCSLGIPGFDVLERAVDESDRHFWAASCMMEACRHQHRH